MDEPARAVEDDGGVVRAGLVFEELDGAVAQVAREAGGRTEGERGFGGFDDPFTENRSRPIIVDFVNDPQERLKGFKTAELSATTDPNLVLNLRAKLDAAGHHDDNAVCRWALPKREDS